MGNYEDFLIKIVKIPLPDGTPVTGELYVDAPRTCILEQNGRVYALGNDGLKGYFWGDIDECPDFFHPEEDLRIKSLDDLAESVFAEAA